MAENGRKNDTKREQAAILFAEGDKTFAEIAKACGVGDRTLFRWQTDPDFKARIKEIQDANSEALQGDGIRRKDNRIKRYQDISERIGLIIAEREAAMSGKLEKRDDDGNVTMVKQYPGGASGLIARSYDKFGNEVLKFDAALVRELRETLKQAAQELGQWTEKLEGTLQTETVTIYLPNNGRD